MIVRHLSEVAGTDREVSADTWTSRRLLLAEDSDDNRFLVLSYLQGTGYDVECVENARQGRTCIMRLRSRCEP